MFDSLIDPELSAVSAAELVSLVREVESAQRRLLGRQHAVVAELVARGVAAEQGYSCTAALLNQLLRISPAEAKARVRTATHELGPRRAISGEALPAVFEQTAAALASGAISGAHASVITRTVRALPLTLREEQREQIDTVLAAQARVLDPAQLTVAARRIVAHLDPDGAEPRDTEQQARRELAFRELPDGTWAVTGRLTPATAAVTRAALDPLAKPCPDIEGTDDRTPAQRMHDALHDLAVLALTGDDLPASGGTPATVLITMTKDQAETGHGTVRTATGEDLTVTAALRLADQALLIPVVFDQHGAIIGHGADCRLAGPHQRRLLTARDQGCSFPGCSRPPKHCQAHHITEWRHGGPTILTNLTLVCGHHHRTFEQRGWTCHLTNGVPEWTPPPLLDPDQKPLRNTAHDIPDLVR